MISYFSYHALFSGDLKLSLDPFALIASIFDRKYEDNKMWACPPREQRNLLDCVRLAAKPSYDAEALHRLSSTLLTGSIAMKLGRPLEWDPIKEEFVNDAEANALRARPASRDWGNA